MNAMLKIGYYAWHDKVVGDKMVGDCGGRGGDTQTSLSISIFHNLPPHSTFPLQNSNSNSTLHPTYFNRVPDLCTLRPLPDPFVPTILLSVLSPTILSLNHLILVADHFVADHYVAYNFVAYKLRYYDRD